MRFDRFRRSRQACLRTASSPGASMTARRFVAHGMPAPARLRCANAPERYYVGRRAERTEVHVVSRSELEPLAHLSYRGDAAFNWGRLTEGALELAFAMLVRSTESRPPDLVCRAFCREVVACLDPAGFMLSHGDIALWLMTAACDGGPSPDGPGPERPIRLGCWPTDWIRSRRRRP
jgi:uncharacterized protein DUF6166